MNVTVKSVVELLDSLYEMEVRRNEAMKFASGVMTSTAALAFEDRLRGVATQLEQMEIMIKTMQKGIEAW